MHPPDARPGFRSVCEICGAWDCLRLSGRCAFLNSDEVPALWRSAERSETCVLKSLVREHRVETIAQALHRPPSAARSQSKHPAASIEKDREASLPF